MINGEGERSIISGIDGLCVYQLTVFFVSFLISHVSLARDIILAISPRENSELRIRELFAPRTNTPTESNELAMSSNTFRDTANLSQNSTRENESVVKR